MTPSCFLDFMMYICVDDHDARLARQLDREIDEELKRDWSSQQMVVGKYKILAWGGNTLGSNIGSDNQLIISFKKILAV